MGILEFSMILVYNMILMLLLTIMMASLTLMESKFLALVQRSVGPQFIGYKGSLQYIADALKLFMKGALIPSETNKFWFITMPSMVAAICYSFWMNAVWGPSVSLFEVEFNIIYVSLFSVLFGMCVMLTGFFSSNKYAMLAAVRTGIGMLNLEIFLGLMLLNVIFMNESFSFLPIVVYQEVNWLIFYFFVLIGLMTMTFLLETNSAPFDLAEAESELVAGYQTEYGGFLFGLYYLGEYMHLFFFSMVISMLFLGGWELPIFMLNYFLDYYDPLIDFEKTVSMSQLHDMFLKYMLLRNEFEDLIIASEAADSFKEAKLNPLDNNPSLPFQNTESTHSENNDYSDGDEFELIFEFEPQADDTSVDYFPKDFFENDFFNNSYTQNSNTFSREICVVNLNDVFSTS